MIEFIIDGELGEWDAGRITRPPIIDRARFVELEKRLRKPANDVDSARAVEIDHGEMIEIIEEIPELNPGSPEHFRAVVRAMGGTTL